MEILIRLLGDLLPHLGMLAMFLFILNTAEKQKRKAEMEKGIFPQEEKIAAFLNAYFARTSRPLSFQTEKENRNVEITMEAAGFPVESMDQIDVSIAGLKTGTLRTYLAYHQAGYQEVWEFLRKNSRTTDTVENYIKKIPLDVTHTDWSKHMEILDDLYPETENLALRAQIDTLKDTILVIMKKEGGETEKTRKMREIYLPYLERIIQIAEKLEKAGVKYRDRDRLLELSGQVVRAMKMCTQEEETEFPSLLRLEEDNAQRSVRGMLQ